jgi:serine protease AprX
MAMTRVPKTLFPAAVLAVLLAVTTTGVSARQSLLALVTNDLLGLLLSAPNAPIRVIVQGDVPAVLDVAHRHGLSIQRVLDQFVVVTATAAQVSALRNEPVVKLLASDMSVQSAMVVSDRAIAADQARAGAAGFLGLGSFPGVTGRGVGVAVVDSGISNHRALANKVVAAVSFIPNDLNVEDAFGHGTHIAGIIAGSPSAASYVTTQYKGGIAPGAHLVNVRVLGPDGVGLTSNVIAGLDWVIANRARYGIKVVNLSLGRTVTGPCVADPLCASVARAVQAGVLVVASAGNRGKTADGRIVLGGVTSPGNSAFALTVGALNTWGTVARKDDSVTSYSSRGPGAYDLAIKPDVVAPGNKIISLEAHGSYLSRNYPSGHHAGSGNNAYFQMSGTSMAAAMVSGGAALMFEASPGLQPLQAKLAFQVTASFMLRDGLMAAGTGSVNVWAARRLAATGLTAVLPASVIGGVSAPASGVSFLDDGTLMPRLYDGLGRRLLGILDVLTAWLNPAAGTGQLQIVGLLNPLGATSANQIIWADMSTWTSGNQIIWADQIFDPQGQQIIWADYDTIEGDQIIWADTYMPVDSSTRR